MSQENFVMRKILTLSLLICIFGGCASAGPNLHSTDPAHLITTTRQGYPSHWWKIVSEDQAAWWEILPQAAGPGEVVLSKRNELGLLSNFAATPFEFHGKRYPSLEGFWQMMKYPEGPSDLRALNKSIEWKHTCEEVAQMTAFEAKAAGDLASANMKNIKIDWVTFEGKRIPYWINQKGEHYNLIVAAMRAKIEQNPEVRRVLLATGDLKLLADHHQDPKNPPAWFYNHILMEIRDEL